MKKTGLEIVEMRAKGNIPEVIKVIKEDKKYYWDKVLEEYFDGTAINTTLDILTYLNDEFEIIEEPKVWKPKDGEEYWVIQCETVEKRFWINDEYDIIAYSIGNCFKTKEQAEKYLEKIKIYTQLKRYAEEHNTDKIDWTNEDQEKWYISFDKYDKKFNIYCCCSCNIDLGQLYFTSKVICERAIEHIGEDNIKKLFKE